MGAEDGVVTPLGTGPRIAVLVDRPDWHARRLVRAFGRRGARARCVSLRDCAFDSAARHGVTLPGFKRSLPDGCFVRCVPGGSFEQVTHRLGILHALEALGVVLRNDARAVERCVDKSTTTFRLAGAGLPTPRTWTCETEAEAREIARREATADRPLVLKPLFGSQGKGLRLVSVPDDLPPAEEVEGLYYLQRFVGEPAAGWHDWRVLVAGGRPIAAMARHGTQWITNRHQGARCEAVALAEPLTGLAVAAADAVGAGYAGVDIIRDRRGGLQVLEVNSMPAWSGLQQVTSIDVTQALADSFLEQMRSRSPLQSAAAPAEAARRA